MTPTGTNVLLQVDAKKRAVFGFVVHVAVEMWMFLQPFRMP
jgi:hypothetical protein